MYKTLILIGILFILLQAANAQYPASDPVISRCPTLQRIIESGEIGQVTNPVFVDEQQARQFAKKCAGVVAELDVVGPLPGNYALLRRQAVLAAEFLTGELYMLDNCKAPSVVKLREQVKIPPPGGFVYVKKYAGASSMPPEVADVFSGLSGSEETNVRGVTIQGRYIALLDSKYPTETADNLSHEMVHAYITLACPKDLPRWFQEGAAVYFSTGRDSKLYGNVGDPKMVEMTLPEDYKTKLYSFQYIERTAGKEKLYEFVRRSVETGRVEPRKALGLGPRHAVERKSPPVALFIGLGVIALLVIGWFVWRHDSGWAE